MLCYVTVSFNNSMGGLLNDKGRVDTGYKNKPLYPLSNKTLKSATRG